MPAKSAQKRPRASSGTPSAAVAAGAESATLARRKRRAGSATFEDDGSESDSTPQAKRARGGNISGNEADVNDVVMDELQKSRKRGGEDRANGPSKSAGSGTAGASQPSSKRDRKSNGVASSTSTSSVTVIATASSSLSSPTGPTTTTTAATAAIAVANGLDSNPARQEQQHRPTLATTTATAAAEETGIAVATAGEGRERREGGIIGGGRPPLASPGMRGKSGRRSVVASALGRSGGPSASVGSLRKKGNSNNSSRSREQAEKQTGASVGATATVQASPVVNGSAAGAVVDSPARGVSPSRLRRIAGSEEEDSANGRGGGAGGAGSDLRLRPGEAEEEQGSGDFARRRGRKDWAEKILCLRLPALDASTATRAVQNLSLKGALLLVMLLGAWAISTSAVFVAAGFRGGAHGSASGGRGRKEGVSRRAKAVSLLQDTDEFRSLEGVLEGRQRHLSGVQMLDQEILAAMEPLREAAVALERKMSLLRNQAVSGASSRGLPEKPEAMEEVARSQLSEVEGMAKTLNEAHHATSENVAAGQKWADDAERDLQKMLDSDKWRHDRAREAEREARAAWKAEVESRLTPAYLAIEDIAAAADAVRHKRALKPGIEDVHGYERKVQEMSKPPPPPQEAEAVKVASITHQGPELKQRVKTIVARQVGREWALPDEGEAARDKSGPSESPALKRTVYKTKQLVASELEIFVSGGTGMPDYAARVSGASVAEGRLGSEREKKRLTSRTLAAAVLPWGQYAAHVLGLAEGRYGGDAEDALSASNVPGDCFAFPGGGGRLTVNLGGGRWAAEDGTGAAAESGGRRPPQGRLRVTHVSIEHAAVASVPSAFGSAPHAFRVLGWDADPTASPTSSTPWGFHDTDNVGKGKGGSDASPLRPHVLVKQAEFSVASGAPAVQTFAATADVPPVGWVTLEVESNHGAEWTCLYGFRVHGHRVD